VKIKKGAKLRQHQAHPQPAQEPLPPRAQESCDVGLEDDDKFGWKLKVKGNCKDVLDDINKKLREYGRRYFEDRLVFEPSDKAKTRSEEQKAEEN
jgi:hypothetical protein